MMLNRNKVMVTDYVKEERYLKVASRLGGTIWFVSCSRQQREVLTLAAHGQHSRRCIPKDIVRVVSG